MKAKGSRVCSGAIVLFVFVCLLLAGAGRLIASEGDGQRMPDLSQRQACLCAAPNAARSSAFAAARRERQHSAGKRKLYEDRLSGISLG